MSVPLTLLGLLERGPSHGYATLSRLARDGKAVAGPVEQEAGPERRRYIITDEGVADVEKWLAEPAPPEPDLQSELFAKVVLALMLSLEADLRWIDHAAARLDLLSRAVQR
jgi:DNA-binding PadR family transcriptional regulator